jgi:ATP-dependent helicase/nuclease subunit A
MYDALARYRTAAQRLPLEKLLGEIYADTRILTFVSALSDGAARRENLNELIGRAAGYERGTYKGLYSFILYLEKCMKNMRMRERGNNAPGNCVNMMTAHAAKGLEFTAVIFVECAAPLSEKSEKTAAGKKLSVSLHKDIGPCPVYVSDNLDYKCDTLYTKTSEMIRQAENYAEEMRILYVGATRAKQRLFFTACVSQSALEALKKSDADLLTGLGQTPSYLKWLYAGIAPENPDAISSAEGYATDRWTVREVRPFEAEQPQAVTPDEEIIEAGPGAAESAYLAQRLNARLSQRYAYADDALIPAKVTVTQMKEGETLAYGRRVIEARSAPDFTGRKSALSAAAAGTALHAFMQHLDEARLASDSDVKKLESQLREMGGSGILSEEEAAAVDTGAVARFLQSPLGGALLGASRVRKELAFLMRISPGRLDARWTESERTVLLQGVIDCVFDSDGRTYLIDYKTDAWVSEDVYARACARYARQLSLYAEALGRIEGKRPDEAYIVFIRQGRAQKVAVEGD